MRRHRWKSTSYGMKGGEGPNKGKKLVRYEAQDPSGKFQIAGMMHDPATAPRTAWVRFYPVGEGWKASGVRTVRHDWGDASVWVEGQRFG